MPTAFTKEPKPDTTYDKAESAVDLLLKEDTFHLLLESGGRIVIARGYVNTEYTKEHKP